MVQEQGLHLKAFLGFWVITWKLLFSLREREEGVDKNLMDGIFLGGGEWTNFQLVGQTLHHPPTSENPPCYNLVSIFKTNNLQKKKAIQGLCGWWNFSKVNFYNQSRNAVNFQEFIYFSSSHSNEKYVEMISTSHCGKFKHTTI